MFGNCRDIAEALTAWMMLADVGLQGWWDMISVTSVIVDSPLKVQHTIESQNDNSSADCAPDDERVVYIIWRVAQ